MKRIILLIALVISLSQMAYSEWKLASEAVKGSWNNFVTNDNNFYMTNGGTKLYRSTDNGVTWLALKTPSVNYIEAIGVDGEYIYLGTNRFTHISSNNGNTWTRANVNLLAAEIFSLLIDGNNIYEGCALGVLINKNRDTLWSFTNDGMIWGDIKFLKSGGGKIYAGSKSNGICYSTNDGAKWIDVTKGLGNDSLTALEVSDNKLYVGTRNGIYLSTNDGTTWTDISYALTKRYITAIAVKDNNVVIGTKLGGIFSLTENTSVWKECNDGVLNGSNITISALLVVGDTLFGGYAGWGLYKSGVNEWITGVEDQRTIESGLDIYPNPAIDNITISLSNSAVPIQKLSIYNSLGIEIKQFDTKDLSAQNSINFSTEGLPSGIYQCVVTSGYERIIKSFVVVK